MDEVLTSQSLMNHKAKGKFGSWSQRLVSLHMLNSQPSGEIALPPLVPLLLPSLLKPFTGKPQQLPKPLLGLHTGPISNLLPLSCSRKHLFREMKGKGNNVRQRDSDNLRCAPSLVRSRGEGSAKTVSKVVRPVKCHKPRELSLCQRNSAHWYHGSSNES